MKYAMISGKTMEDFVLLVNQAIGQGWRPYGNPMLAVAPPQIGYFQAMTYEEPTIIPGRLN